MKLTRFPRLLKPPTSSIARCVTSCGVHPANLSIDAIERVAVVSVTETGKAMSSTRRNVLRAVLGNALPLIGLGFAVIVNVAWIGFLGYFFFKLV
jgi:hypothetical protein